MPKMNLCLSVDNSLTVASEALWLSQQPSDNRHHLDVAALDMEDSFLVSDDEEEVRKHHQSAIDCSPIPVRTLQRHTAASKTTVSKRNMVKNGLNYNVKEESEPKSTQILLPYKGQTKSRTLIGLALQPRNARFQEFQEKSSNLQEPKSNTLQSLNLFQTQSQPQNLAHQQKLSRPTFPHLATTVATAISTATDAHNHGASESLKRVTFSETPSLPQDTMPMESRSRYPSRMRTRSQAIAIRKDSSIVSSSMDFQEQGHDDAISYNEKLYDSATWRMYHRIVEHRQNQQRYQRELSTSASSSSFDSSLHDVVAASDHHDYQSKASRNMLLSQVYAVHPGYAPSNSSVASTMDHDDEDIFEMEL
jgi:hypothetical protein